jgi:hypothetical protein
MAFIINSHVTEARGLTDAKISNGDDFDDPDINNADLNCGVDVSSDGIGIETSGVDTSMDDDCDD